MIGHSITDGWEPAAEIWSIDVVSMVVRIVVVDRVHPLIRIVVAIAGHWIAVDRHVLILLHLHHLLGGGVLGARGFRAGRWGHGCAHVNGRRVHLDSNLSHLRCDKLRRLLVSLFLLLLRLLLHQLLILHEGDILLSCHLWCSTGGRLVATFIPGCVGQLLHLKKRIRLNLVLHARILILSIQVLSVVLLRIHQTDVLFQLLPESFREGFINLTLDFIYFLLVHEKLNQHVILKDARLASAVGEYHDSEAVLNAALPAAPVDAAVGPVHLAVADLDVAVVAALVVAAGRPAELALPVLHVLVVLALVRVRHLVTPRLLPHALAFLHPLHEDARVGVAV